MTRMPKDEYFMRIAYTVACRSTCLDKKVGCVLVNKRGIILSTGYNGAPRDMEHCDVCRVAQTNSKNSCPAAHAEQNALLYAMPDDVFICYSTLEPCVMCTRMLMNTNCKKVIFGKETNIAHTGERLWSELHDSTTWQHRPIR